MLENLASHQVKDNEGVIESLGVPRDAKKRFFKFSYTNSSKISFVVNMVLSESQGRVTAKFKIFKQIPGVPVNQTPEEGEIDNEVKLKPNFDDLDSMPQDMVELVRNNSSSGTKSKFMDRKVIFELLSRVIGELDFIH